MPVCPIERKRKLRLVPFRRKENRKKKKKKGIANLDTSIGDRTDLLAVELLPSLPMEFFIERYNIITINKIDEGISDVALVLKKKAKE
mgnify:CR=1 FL=1